MTQSELLARDGTVLFLPHRLNRQPVVVRGLTADELFTCAGLSSLLGAIPGSLLAWAFGALAMIPTAIVLSVALGILIGGGFLRRQKRGRPETWLYRNLQMRITRRVPALAGVLGGHDLIHRSGAWSTRRTQHS
ncbi:MAG: TIGR03750 family conjugal transfer protein [Proteobacteria bacterium]|jgi:conjugative transfer region protein (TIGR03750 family)|nr:TIGR03750 family conjugal transfer protein [Pseudomonadota bacterium]